MSLRRKGRKEDIHTEMKAIVLSAGQGSRLLPLTESIPKCLLLIDEQTLLEHQIRGLLQAGVEEIVVVTGFGAGAVERCLENMAIGDVNVRCVFNPFFNVADNLASCWMARHEMAQEFLLLNGDTLFKPSVCESLLAAPESPVTLAIDRKSSYDSDDMKVRLDGVRLVEVGKTLGERTIDGESVGMTRFVGDGPDQFVTVLEQLMRTPNSLSWWYLKAIGILADRGAVQIHSIEGLSWSEIDFPHDLDRARALFALN